MLSFLFRGSLQYSILCSRSACPSNSPSWQFVGVIRAVSKSQMYLIGNLMLFMFTEKVVLKPNDVSVFTTLTINGRLFACPREQFDSLVGVDGLLRAALQSEKLVWSLILQSH